VPGLAGARNYSEHTAQAIDDAVREIVAAAFKRALDLLAQSRETLERTANLLLERETLVEADLRAVASQFATARKEIEEKAAA
jgi:cell division protease FtsH